MKYKICKECNKQYMPNSRTYKRQKFCSLLCQRQRWQGKYYRTWYLNNRDRVNRKARERHNNPKVKYQDYKKHAIRRKVAFNITFKVFMSFWQKPCFYCRDNIDTIGLDRMNNNRGYSINNIVPCCSACNIMKMTRSRKEFINKCVKIVAIHKGA